MYVWFSTVYLRHNTIARNIGGDGSGVHITSFEWEGTVYPSTVTLTNTILVSHSVGISVTVGNTVTVNGILWDSGTPITVSQSITAIVMVQNQHTGDPAFVDPDAGDYHISPGSAAVDAGVNAGVTDDIDGQPWPSGLGYDIGADELGLAVAVDPTTGDTLVYTDTQGSPTVIQVPGGAVTETITLVYTPVETTTSPSGFAFAGHAFDLDACRGGLLLPGFVFSVPVTITLHYSDADVVGLDEDTLVLEYWNEVASAWEDAACGPYDRHPGENWLAMPICHLSRFALFGEREYRICLPLVLCNH